MELRTTRDKVDGQVTSEKNFGCLRRIALVHSVKPMRTDTTGLTQVCRPCRLL